MKSILSLLFLSWCVTCAAQKPVSQRARLKQPTLIYKTKGNYDNRVPILLSDDKTEIVAYLAPTDLYYAGKLALPTKLKRGYRLDNRGIGPNVAFLKLTYSQYQKLAKAPSLPELYALIVDKDPLLELYDCGDRANFKHIERELNQAIERRRFATYRRLK